MKHICKATSLLALIALPFGAFAQSSPTDLSNFSPRAKLQFRYSLDNSYRKNAMDLITATARFGFNYKYKNVFGVLEAQAEVLLRQIRRLQQILQPTVELKSFLLSADLM